MKYLFLAVLPLFLPMLWNGFSGGQEPLNTPTSTSTPILPTNTPTAAVETPQASPTPTPTPINSRYLFDPEYYCDDYQVVVNPDYVIDYEVCVRYRLINQTLMYLDVKAEREPVGLEGYEVYYRGFWTYEDTPHPHFLKQNRFYNPCYLGPINEEGFATCRISISCTSNPDKPIYYMFDGVMLYPQDRQNEITLPAVYRYTYDIYQTQVCQ